METPPHGNEPKKRTLPKMESFEEFRVFTKIIGNPLKTYFY